MRIGSTLSLFVIASIGLGTSFVGIETGLAAVPPVLFAAFRFDFAAVLLLGFVAYRYEIWTPQSRNDVFAIVASGVFVVAINNGLLFVGQQYTTSGAAAVTYGLLPVISPLFAFLLLSDRISAIDFGGILVGLVGVLILVSPTPGSLGDSTYGQSLIAIAALSIALGSVATKRFKPTLAMLPLSAWAMALGAVLLHITSVAIGETTSIAWTPETLTAVVYVGIPGTAVAYGAYFLLIAQAGPVHANLVAYTVPAVATVSGWLVLGEVLSATTVIGFFIILAGFVVIQRSAVRELRANYRRPPGYEETATTDRTEFVTDD